MELFYIKKEKSYKKAMIFAGIVALIISSIFTYIQLNSASEVIDSNNAQIEEESIVVTPKGNRISISFVGDILMHGAQRSAGYIKDKNTYDFSEFFADTKPYFKDKDYVVGSLETPIMYENSDSKYSGYPTFKAPPKLVEAIKDAGINVMMTANNHILDYRTDGAIETMDWLEKNELLYTGTFKSKQDKIDNPILFVEKNNIKLALINYTQITNLGGEQYVLNILDLNAIKKDIEFAKNNKVDKIIVWVHLGAEYQRQPSENDKEMIRKIAEYGADIIIGSHPHVVRPMEILNVEEREVFVAYSLGNFISNQFWRHSTDGIILNMDIVKTAEDVFLENINYIPTAVVREYNGNEIKNEKTIKTSSDDSDYITYAGSRGMIWGDNLNFRIVPIKDAIYNYENKLDLKLTEKDYMRLKTSWNDTTELIGENNDYKIYTN